MKGKRYIDAAVFQGSRSYQQDTVARYASPDGECVIGILSDGIGGHGYGHLASKLIARACLAALEPQADAMKARPETLPHILRSAANAANGRIADMIAEQPKMKGMGATLIAAAIVRDTLYWCSIGDSHLSVYRKKEIERVNADHSLANGIDNLMKIGAIDRAMAKNNQQTSLLTSAVSGSEFKKVDCPEEGVPLHSGEMVLIASDGIETLEKDEVAKLCEATKGGSPAQLCGRVIRAVERKRAPRQDNLSVIAVI